MKPRAYIKQLEYIFDNFTKRSNTLPKDDRNYHVANANMIAIKHALYDAREKYTMEGECQKRENITA